MARTARNRSRNSSPPVERRREPSPEYDSATDDDESELDDVDMSRLLTCKDEVHNEEHRVRFYLGRVNEERREALRKKIEQYGGHVISKEPRLGYFYHDMNKRYYVLVEQQDFPTVSYMYETSRNVYVEMWNFVDLCIRQRKFKTESVNRSKRNEFTLADEKHLIEWIAQRMPYPEHPRKGKKEYVDLINNAKKLGINNWAKRHTWQSWRDHYVKNQDRLDPLIEAVLAKIPPSKNGKGLAEIRSQRGRKRRRTSNDDDDDYEEVDIRSVQEEEEEGDADALPVARREDEEEEVPAPARRRATTRSNNRRPLADTQPAVVEDRQSDNPRPHQRRKETSRSTTRRTPPVEQQENIPDGQDDDFLNDEPDRDAEKQPAGDDADEYPSDLDDPFEVEENGVPPEREADDLDPLYGPADFAPFDIDGDAPLDEADNVHEGEGEAADGPVEEEVGQGKGYDEITAIDVLPDEEGDKEVPDSEEGEDEEAPFYTMATDHNENLRQIRAQLEPQQEHQRQQVLEENEVEVVAQPHRSKRPATRVEVVLTPKPIRGKQRAVDAVSATQSVVMPPYRNTRSRSRSVEPTFTARPPSKRSRQRKADTTLDQQQAPASLQVIEEDDDGDDAAEVADMVMDEVNEPLLLSDDDTQTSRRLSGGQATGTQARATDGTTPRRTRARAHEDDQDEIFPSPDTRARQARDREIEEAKKAPFEPLEGTRAAKLLRSMTRQQQSGRGRPRGR